MSQIQDALSNFSPEQCRAARAILKMTYLDTCQAADLSQVTLSKFEAGGEVRAAVVERLRAAFEARGITFAPDGLGLTWQRPAG